MVPRQDTSRDYEGIEEHRPRAGSAWSPRCHLCSIDVDRPMPVALEVRIVAIVHVGGCRGKRRASTTVEEVFREGHVLPAVFHGVLDLVLIECWQIPCPCSVVTRCAWIWIAILD